MSQSGALPYLGSRISLISKAAIRYEGTLYTIDTVESTVALAKVKSYGTEDRPCDRPVPPREEIYEYIIFRGSDISDLHVCEPPKPNCGLVQQDPAIVKVDTMPSAPPPGFPAQPLGPPVPQQQQQQRQQQQQPAIGGNTFGGSGPPPQAQQQQQQQQQQQAPIGHRDSQLAAGVRHPGAVVSPPKQPQQRRQQQQQQQQPDPQEQQRAREGGRRNEQSFHETVRQPRGDRLRQQHQPQQQQYQQHQQQNQQQQQQQHQQGFGSGDSRRGSAQQVARRPFGLYRGGVVRQPFGHPQHHQQHHHQQQQRQASAPTKFEGDYDFESANEDLAKELEKLQVDPEVDEVEDHDGANGGEAVASSTSSGGNVNGYDKAKSFFDNISSEAVDRASGKSVRPINWREERKINTETFGFAPRGGRGRGGRGHRGGYGRGGGYGGYARGYGGYGGYARGYGGYSAGYGYRHNGGRGGSNW